MIEFKDLIKMIEANRKIIFLGTLVLAFLMMLLQKWAVVNMMIGAVLYWSVVKHCEVAKDHIE